MRRPTRIAGTAAIATTIGWAGVLVPGNPAAADVPPYPDVSRYTEIPAEVYRIPGKPGIWFTAPWGLQCGIWDDGSAGCTGPIPGAPGGASQIAWFAGQPTAAFDNTATPNFRSFDPQRLLRMDNFVRYQGTTCAATARDALYCFHGSDDERSGGARFLVSPVDSRVGGDPD